MAAMLAQNVSVVAAARPTRISARKSVASLPVARGVTLKAAVRTQVVSSLRVEKFTAAVTVGTAAALANPLFAEAAITPSLKNTLLSVVAGGIVLAGITAAVVGVSSFDKLSRK
eukprot:CAMPEP_0197585532 /NCGR_PEP_ID=MMETSP1326-20131121/7803_1 /TAXON_ID=1155430 /ORGANISM="Genus nov. species nov., Strain RCC2288" /LENGTH=113 /DNA_ID=CAMNT_0043150049 /DNA_START=137 /DNA_END=478 /DNA_ORIENTATION=+